MSLSPLLKNGMFIQEAEKARMHKQSLRYTRNIRRAGKKTYSQIMMQSMRTHRRDKAFQPFLAGIGGSLQIVQRDKQVDVRPIDNKNKATLICLQKSPVDVLLTRCPTTKKTKAVVDMHLTWRALFRNRRAAKHNVIFYSAAKACVVNTSGTVLFDENTTITSVAIRKEPRICATLVDSAALLAYRQMPQVRLFVKRLTTTLYLLLVFKITAGFQCQECGYTTPSLLQAASHVCCSAKSAQKDFGEVTFHGDTKWTIERNFQMPVVRAAQSVQHCNFGFSEQQFQTAFARNAYKSKRKMF